MEDATVTCLNLVLEHLEGSKAHFRLLLVDFLIFTIQPRILIDKFLNHFNLYFNAVGWILLNQ